MELRSELFDPDFDVEACKAVKRARANDWPISQILRAIERATHLIEAPPGVVIKLFEREDLRVLCEDFSEDFSDEMTVDALKSLSPAARKLVDYLYQMPEDSPSASEEG